MPYHLIRLIVCAMLISTNGAAFASQSLMRPGDIPTPLMPGHEMNPRHCNDLAVELQPAGDFQSMECSQGPATHGGGAGWAVKSKIAAEDAVSAFVVYHYQAGVLSYFERKDPQSLFEYVLNYDVEGSWSAADGIAGYAISRFFGRFDSVQVPCFAFARFGGHVPRSSGYRHRVIGVYCGSLASDQPVPDARIEEMLGKVKTRVF